MPQVYFDTNQFRSADSQVEYIRLIDELKSNNVQLLRFIDNPYDLRKVKNFERAALDQFKGWHLHHIAGEYVDRAKLHAAGMCYHQPYWALEFLTVKDHRHRHSKAYKYEVGLL